MPAASKRCLVMECGKKVGKHSPLCDDCFMTLCSGVVPLKKTTSFLRAIPWMHTRLIAIKSVVTGEKIPSPALNLLMAGIEDDGE